MSRSCLSVGHSPVQFVFSHSYSETQDTGGTKCSTEFRSNIRLQVAVVVTKPGEVVKQEGLNWV